MSNNPSNKKSNSGYEPPEIVVPPELPIILKDYSKAVLLERPDDIIYWSIRYFKNLAAKMESEDATKQQLQDSTEKSGGSKGSVDHGQGEEDDTDLMKAHGSAKELSKSSLRNINKKFGDSQFIMMNELKDAWTSGKMSPLILQQILSLVGGDAYDDGGDDSESAASNPVDRIEFMTGAATMISSTPQKTLITLIEIMSRSSGVGEISAVPVEDARAAFDFLARTDPTNISEFTREEMHNFLDRISDNEDGLVSAKDMASSKCPL